MDRVLLMWYCLPGRILYSRADDFQFPLGQLQVLLNFGYENLRQD